MDVDDDARPQPRQHLQDSSDTSLPSLRTCDESMNRMSSASSAREQLDRHVLDDRLVHRQAGFVAAQERAEAPRLGIDAGDLRRVAAR